MKDVLLDALMTGTSGRDQNAEWNDKRNDSQNGKAVLLM